ncbi:hypothetical protein NPIL_624871 [Nephila pilipes]|uniref:Uncharacterized protein n=1 Tax=Nephila pilipes TaxID=299642 RepID=A0A8X6TEG6_NEPPI|nr:hypothetical protein NPIL_624871 [Nephila pilipes]
MIAFYYRARNTGILRNGEQRHLTAKLREKLIQHSRCWGETNLRTTDSDFLNTRVRAENVGAHLCVLIPCQECSCVLESINQRSGIRRTTGGRNSLFLGSCLGKTLSLF